MRFLRGCPVVEAKGGSELGAETCLPGGSWLVLVCSERKVLLAGCWWLVCSERKVLLAAG
jgi:hypothetical protein